MNMILHLIVSNGTLAADGRTYPCTVGRAGVTADKHEGDGMTPLGSFPLRACYYRPDRLPTPQTALKTIALSPDDGWCDDPCDPLYNQHVRLPFAASHEKLWRDDHRYDLIVPLGYNDEPVLPGRGSAIFLHLMHDDGSATAGCVALKKDDLLALLPFLGPQTRLEIRA